MRRLLVALAMTVAVSANCSAQFRDFDLSIGSQFQLLDRRVFPELPRWCNGISPYEIELVRARYPYLSLSDLCLTAKLGAWDETCKGTVTCCNGDQYQYTFDCAEGMMLIAIADHESSAYCQESGGIDSVSHMGRPNNCAPIYKSPNR